MRVLHLDLDAFFASVEQRDKPSLRGRPVVVGGLGPRGVVATASYEARRFGVCSAMPTSQARARCPSAAYLAGRFGVYAQVSSVVMAYLREVSPLVEPLSLDEAYVDLAGASVAGSPAAERRLAQDVRTAIRARTGLTASVGVASSKLLAKVASELAKPDGLRVVEPGAELTVLHPLPVTVVPGVGPATAANLAAIGVRTVGDLARLDVAELVGRFGAAAGHALHALAHGRDDRPVRPERDTKSISVEDTFDRDVCDPLALSSIVATLADRVAGRLGAHGLSGRTITVKVRFHDFSTVSRSATLPAPTDDARAIARVAGPLLTEALTEPAAAGGVRLLGVGVSGLATWVQDDLFTLDPPPEPGQAAPERPARGSPGPDASRAPRWVPGMDVVHATHGPGWVWGSGRGVVTVRFETADTPPGPVRTFRTDDPELVPVPSALS